MEHEHHARSGRVELPRRLWKLLPVWQRQWNTLFTIPLSIAGIAAFALGYDLAGAALVFTVVALHLARFWVARAFLIRSGMWEQGTWYADVLPSIYRWRAIFLAVLSVSALGTYLLTGAKVHVEGLTLLTVVALALLAPVYVRGAIVPGYIGNWPIVHYRSDEPGRFWTGLCTYTGVIALLSATSIFVVLRAVDA